MKEIKNVLGCIDSAKELIITQHKVYVNTNIVRLDPEDPDNNLYTYDQIQYTKDEYLELQDRIIKSLNEQLTTTQLAIVELYELQAQMQQKIQSGGVE